MSKVKKRFIISWNDIFTLIPVLKWKPCAGFSRRIKNTIPWHIWLLCLLRKIKTFIFSFNVFEERTPLLPALYIYLHLSPQQPSLFLCPPSCLPPFFYLHSSCLFLSVLPSDRNSFNTFSPAPSLLSDSLSSTPTPLCSLYPVAYSALESRWSHLEDKVSRLERTEDRETQRRGKQERWRRPRKPNLIVVWNKKWYPSTPAGPPIYCLASDLCGGKSVWIYSQQALQSIHVLCWSGADSCRAPSSLCVCTCIIHEVGT